MTCVHTSLEDLYFVDFSVDDILLLLILCLNSFSCCLLSGIQRDKGSISITIKRLMARRGSVSSSSEEENIIESLLPDLEEEAGTTEVRDQLVSFYINAISLILPSFFSFGLSPSFKNSWKIKSHEVLQAVLDVYLSSRTK